MPMRNVGLARARGFSSMLVLALASLGLSACGGGKGGAGPTAQTPGSSVYLQNCIGCHGPAGQGMGMQPALPGSATVNGDPAALTAWVMFGVRPATMPAGKYPRMMPQFTYLKDDDLAAVLTHLRTSWGNTAAPVTVAEVAAARAAHAVP